MGKLRERIADPALLKLIHGYLKAGKIASKLTREEREEERKERDEGVASKPAAGQYTAR